MWGFAVLIEVTRYLTVTAGMAVTAAGEAGGFGGARGGCASLKAVRLCLVVLALSLTRLWVLPYKGLEAVTLFFAYCTV
jgi:hypothetical protein